jgi:co-chaperonin GroES (HSP10)
MESFSIEQIQPLAKYILVKPLERPAETVTGFLMPEEGYTPTPVCGEVISAGEGSQFKIGDTVFFRRYSVDSLKFTNSNGKIEEVNLISDDEIVAIIKIKK